MTLNDNRLPTQSTSCYRGQALASKLNRAPALAQVCTILPLVCHPLSEPHAAWTIQVKAVKQSRKLHVATAEAVTTRPGEKMHCQDFYHGNDGVGVWNSE